MRRNGTFISAPRNAYTQVASPLRASVTVADMEILRALLETFGAAGAARNAAMVLLDRQAEEDAVEAVLRRLDLAAAA